MGTRAPNTSPALSYAETGADFISVGAITHSVRVLDIGLDIS
jgi:nicotinate-nucleotide pyrophosphorylase (carboxylating)